MKKVLIATTNNDKFDAVRKLLNATIFPSCEYKIYSLKDYNIILEDVKEVGNNEERAQAKALNAYEKLKDYKFDFIIGLDDAIRIKNKLEPNIKLYLEKILYENYMDDGEIFSFSRAYSIVDVNGNIFSTVVEIPYYYKANPKTKIEAHSYPLSNISIPLGYELPINELSEEDELNYYLRYAKEPLDKIKLIDDYNIIDKIEKIVIECGTLIKEAQNDDLAVDIKEGNQNFVTKYDKMVENKLKQALLNIIPDAHFIGEESLETAEVLEEGFTFIVDPIDGTTNFTQSYQLSAISVALLKDGKSYISVCYNPYTDELFKAQKGKGAYLNNKKINVSKKELKNGIVFCGSSPYYNEVREKSFDIQKKISLLAGDFRRFGSAVIEMCYIACGRAELYYELKLQPWDFAAATLIVEEAGGKVTTLDGDAVKFDKPSSIVASNNMEDYLKHFIN